MRSLLVLMFVFAVPQTGEALSASVPGRDGAVSNPPSQIVLHAGPLTLGLSYARSINRVWEAGVTATGGKHLGATITREHAGDLDVWMSAYAQVAAQIVPHTVVIARPIGVVVLTGGDFSAAYPSAGGGIEYRLARMRFGTDVQVIRIAGPNGTGEYWVRWLPARIAVAL